MVTCIKCRAAIEDDSIYCRFCGKKQVSTSGEKRRKPHGPNGSGTVYKRGNSWYAYVRVIRNGQVIARRAKGGFPTKAAALEYLPQLKNSPDAAKAYTIEQMFTRVQATQKWLKISPDKRSHYLTAYKKLAPIHQRDVASLKYFELQNLIDGIDGAFYPKRDAKTVLQKIYDLAAIQELIPMEKPAIIKMLELPSKPLTTQDARTPDEMAAFWDDWRKAPTPIAGYALVMAYTGMRTGELFALDLQKIDLPRRVAVGGIKTAAGIDRQIPIADCIAPVFEYLLPLARYGLVAYDENEYYAQWAQLIQRTGVRPLGSYCQRHTCATRLQELVPAVSRPVINSILGHSNGKIDDTYTHITLETKLAAVNRLPVY